MGSYSISLWNVQNARIENCTLDPPTNIDTALTIYESYNISIENNVINDHIGLVVLSESRNITVNDNDLSSQGMWVAIGVGTYSSSNFSLISNSINGAEIGINIRGSTDGLINRNDINSTESNIKLQDSLGFTIYHNNLFGSPYYFATDNKGSENLWDKGYPIGGNFWADYSGSDNNGDGIGDSPYIIDSNSQDNYPLMEPYSGELPEPSILISTGNITVIRQTPGGPKENMASMDFTPESNGWWFAEVKDQGLSGVRIEIGTISIESPIIVVSERIGFGGDKYGTKNSSKIEVIAGNTYHMSAIPFGKNGASAIVIGWFEGYQNLPPVAIITTDSYLNPTVLDGSHSFDPDGTIVSYEWDLGDGNTATDSIIYPSYTESGFYYVQLTITDDSGSSDSTSIEIEIRIVTFIPHVPILIIGNGAFTAANGVTDGSGIESDPFIIEGWEVNASGTNPTPHTQGAGIQIKDTTAFFIIQNVKVRDGYPINLGIWLWNADNGIVRDCHIIRNDYGISALKSDNIQILNNFCTGNSISGIVSAWSTNCLISWNNCSDNYGTGISMHGESNVRVSNNSVWHNNNIGIETDPGLYYLVENNMVTYNGGGIQIETSNSIYRNNFIAYNDGYGMMFANAYANEIHRNIVMCNYELGFDFHFGMSGYQGRDNCFWENAFIYNRGTNDTYNPSNPQARALTGYNYFSQEGVGNYWHDWTYPDDNGDGIVDSSYVMESGAQDPYPLVTPSIPVEIPY